MCKTCTEAWQKNNKARMRGHKLAWYYKNRKVINLMFSKATSSEPDAADLYYLKTHPKG